MKSRIWTSICALVAILSLSACGGGGGGSGTASPTDDPAGGDNQGGGLGPVDGDFYFSSETEKFYQNPDADVRQELCKTSDYYFESENFIVFSNLTTHSDDDLRRAATKAQGAMDAILPKFGMDWTTFYAMKRVVSFRDLNQFALEASQLTYQDGSGADKRLTIDQIAPEYFADKMPAGFTDWRNPSSDPNLQYAFVYNTLINEEDPKKVRDVMLSAHDGYDQFFVDNPTYDDLGKDWNDQWAPFFKKIQICATGNRTTRSSTSGFKISPDYADAVYRHEAAHLIINQVSKVTAFWAKEGQTHLFLGESVPESIENVASIRDEYLLGTEISEPGDENLDKFKKAYLALVERDDVNIDKIMDWHRLSMTIKAEWLASDEEGTGDIISDTERKEGIKEAFGIVMPISYDVFFDNL